jgi:hypothetical protein
MGGTTLSTTMDEAAVAALTRYNPSSILAGLEYAGSLCRTYFRKFTFSIPNIGYEDSSNPSPCPVGTTEVAIYHTHGRATSKSDGELFSLQDMRLANGLRNIGGATFILDAVPVYLATPTGRIKRFDPRPKSDPFDGRGTPVTLKQRTPIR